MCRWNCNWNRNCCMCRGCRWENQCGSWCGNRCCNYWENQCGRQQENRCENRCSEQRENRCENRCGEQRENQCGRQQENRCGNGWGNPWAANEVCRMCYNQGFTAGFAAGTVRTAQESELRYELPLFLIERFRPHFRSYAERSSTTKSP